MMNYRNFHKDRETYCLRNQNYGYTGGIIGENVNLPLDISGIWDSNYGRIVINQVGNKIVGYYDWKDGLLYGKMDENILSGYWEEKPTYKPPTDAGKLLFRFSMNDFVGRWGFANQPLYFGGNGKKISELFLGNCIRYQVSHNALNIPTIIVNGEKITYGQQSSYFYPEECLSHTNLKLIIDAEIYLEKISVKPGFSYTFSIKGKLPDFKIDVIVDNPFH